MFNTKEQEIIQYGLKNGKSKEEIQEAITNYRLGVSPMTKNILQEQTYLQDVGQDISQIGTDIKKATDIRVANVQDIIKSKESGETGFLRSGLQAVGQGAGYASDIIESTFKGVVKAILPQKTEIAIKGGIEKVATPIVESDIVKSVLEKYNSLDAESKRDIDAALGFVSLGTDVAGIVGGAKLVKQGVKTGIGATKAIIKTGANLIKETGNILSGGKSYAISRIPKLMGIFSGENDDVIRYALSNPVAAKQGLEAGDVALRKVVQEGASKSIQLKNAFLKGYSQAKNKILGQYTKTLVKKTDIRNSFVKLLEENGVKIKYGVLNFTKSKIIANPGEITKIEAAWRALRKWDKMLTIDSLDEYKQLVGQLTRFATEAGIPSKSPVLGRLYYELNNIAKTKLPKNIASKYIALNEKFSSNIELYDDIVKAFNSGDPFTKFANALSANKDTLRQVLDFYEKQTGKSVLPVVAGRTLAAEKQAAFGFLNPRSWIDFFVSPETQGKIILKAGEILPK